MTWAPETWVDMRPSPWSIQPIVLVAFGILPALDMYLGVLPVQLLSRSEDHVQRCLGALFGGQICHFAATKLGFHPLRGRQYPGMTWSKGGWARTPGLSAMKV